MFSGDYKPNENVKGTIFPIAQSNRKFQIQEDVRRMGLSEAITILKLDLKVYTTTISV